MPPYDVIVIGAGAAGLLAATRAAERGRRTLLVEKNRRPGVKILMSGGTRCNLTHATDRRGIVAAFGKQQGSFLHSALAALGPDELVAMFNAEGVATKVEPGGKIFPVSDRAVDVLAALERMRTRSGAELVTDAPVDAVRREGETFVVTAGRHAWQSPSVILTVGGQSYPGSGATGDGYAWAKSLGHSIIPPRPALTPLTSNERWVQELRGVTVPDVEVTISETSPPGRGKGEGAPGTSLPLTPASQSLPPALRRHEVAGARCSLSRREREQNTRRGSFLFTHFGLSGPVVMDLSRIITARPQAANWIATCDFLPSVKEPELLARLADEAAQSGKRGILGLVAEWTPRRLAEALLHRAGVPEDRRIAELSRAERTALVAALKSLPIPIAGSLGFKKAEVTAGGVALDEVDSRTMQSKLVPNLYIAGELLDLDGPIGGYNFQAAFSTGALAGQHA